ncbi:MAG: RNA polymerase sigma factor [Desulfobacterales bacterium]|jgi:RNA polymerase sigma-70 factor (ECF subfamily)|nr:RNA polymerase sigma factor [Desulfobacterales bacterium]
MSPKNAGNTGHATAENSRSAGTDSEDTDPEFTDHQLVRRIKSGESWASERLMRRYYSKARALAFQMCDRNADEAEDLTQQAFLNALGGIGKFQENASFKTWFYRILINTCRDMRRRRRRWLGVFAPVFSRGENGEETPFSPEAVPDETETGNPDSVYRHNHMNQDIQQALESLPEQQRMVFQLKVVQELSIPEISEILTLAPGTIKSHLFRATKTMRNALAEWAGR